ncbi:phosphohydrolase [Acidovorax sp. Leaf84]|jgi:putative two-component system response regulator|uniref:HD-GYP domain-containing protein n=1 Tax=unclassified Acidovorax TaxID=2684926 RepID=UPI0006FC498A|nr:phosphohydrolase [Acidovorax sp. Leaf84]
MTAVRTTPLAPREEPRCFAEEAAAQMERFVEDFGHMYRERNEALREVTRAHHEALLHLSMAAEFRDDDTSVHIIRIGYLAEALALHLGSTPMFARMLRRAAPMHDIGKIGTPDHVLKKAGPLTDEERAVMKQHPEMGAKILSSSRVPVFRLAAEVALTHHERFDGTGYPKGLSGEAIPLCGRITAVADFYDALTMDRVYRPAFSAEKALEMLVELRGTAFDPVVVDAFVDNIATLDALRLQITRDRPTFSDLIDAA